MIDFIEITNELFKNSFVNKLTVEVVSLRLLLEYGQQAVQDLE